MFTRYLFVFMLLLILPGCSVITKLHENDYDIALRSQGCDPYHVYACGPSSLSQLFRELGEKNCFSGTISKEILNHQTLFERFTRDSLALISNDALNITWQSQLERTIQRHGYKFYKKKNCSQKEFRKFLRDKEINGECGIIFMYDSTRLFAFHYEMFPMGEELESKIIICSVYVIKDCLSED